MTAVFDFRCVDLFSAQVEAGYWDRRLVVETQNPSDSNRAFQLVAWHNQPQGSGNYDQLAQPSFSVFGPHVDTICFALKKAYVPDPQKAWFSAGEVRPLDTFTWHGNYKGLLPTAVQNGFVVELKVLETDVTRSWKIGVLALLSVLTTQIGGILLVIAMIFLVLFVRKYPAVVINSVRY